MSHWILMFRPETYQLVQQHGLIGVHPTFRKRFSEMKVGDKFVAYITKRQVLDAHGELSSDPFLDESAVFGERGLYPHRCKVKFEHKNACKPVGDLLWSLTPFTQIEMKTTPANYLRCYGGFMKIPRADFAWLTDVIRGRWLEKGDLPVPRLTC